MSESTKIEWCDSTFNPWIGCTKVSPACEHCYAEVSTASRSLGVNWGAGQPRKRTSAANWKLPIKWNAAPFYECLDCGLRGDAKAMGDDPKVCKHLNAYPARRRVFCASLADVFDNEVDPQWRHDLFKLIAATPDLDWLLLTKRIGNATKLISKAIGPGWIPSNVWLGATICNQEEADRDIPKLLATPAAVRFLSMEPLLEAVDLTHIGSGVITYNPLRSIQGDYGQLNNGKSQINWVIVGGESGHHARPMHPDWVRSLRDQCAAAGVPFLFKQWGEWAPAGKGDDPVALQSMAIQYGRSLHCYTFNDAQAMGRIGKHNAGRTLDGITHTEYPKVTA
jgi:protein gp37